MAARIPTGRIGGRPRKFTDEQINRVRQWKSLKETAEEIGLTLEQATYIRGYSYKSRRGRLWRKSG